MENSSFFEDEASEEARELSRKIYLRSLAAFSLKVLWTSLTASALLGLLLPLTAFFKWSNFILSCLLGLLAGIALAAGIMTSLQNRALISVLLGALILPGLAVYASFLAVRSQQAFDAASSVLLPFVAYATASLIGGIIIAKVWRNVPARGKKEEAEQGSIPIETPALKEHKSHEGSGLDKAA